MNAKPANELKKSDVFCFLGSQAKYIVTATPYPGGSYIKNIKTGAFDSIREDSTLTFLTF